MNFSLAIDINRAALLRLVAGLFASAGIASGEVIARLPRHLRKTILHILRPAEAAAVRLIAMVALQMAAQGLTPKPRPKGTAPTKPIPRGKRTHVPPFALFDPRRQPDASTGKRRTAKGAGPNIRFFDDPNPVFEPVPPAPTPDDPVDAQRLCGRLLALQRALGDLPKQARRLLRMQARRAQPERGLSRPCGRVVRQVTERGADTRSIRFCRSVISLR